MTSLRPSVLLSALLWVCAVAPAPGEGEEGEKPAPPNVILIVSDDQGYGDLACHGNQHIQTPSLDKLYSQSTRLTNFHVSPTCSPTRAALVTGRYSNATGVWHTNMGRSILRDDEATVGRIFADAGYATAMFGKWHLGDNYPSRPEDHGFQHVVRHGGGGVGETPDAWGNDGSDDTYLVNGEPRKFDGYCTDVWFDQAIQFIDSKRAKGAPFLAMLATSATRGAPEKYRGMYAGRPEVPDPDFYGMISNLDDNLARLVGKLDEWGVAENTILVFLSDNGSATGEKAGKGFNAGMRGIKGSAYEGGHRVPFFIRWPGGGVTAGRDISTLTAHVDVLPTLMEFCEITKRPAGAPIMQGRSLVPLLSGDAQRWEPRTLVTDSQQVAQPQKWLGSVVMTDRWRLVEGKELFDVSADPGQTKDVASENGKVVEGLRADYEKWWASISTRFDERCEIAVGKDKEKQVRLTAHDWHGERVPWHQDHVKKGIVANGSWAIDVRESGKYEITLARWPVELEVPIDGKVKGGTAFSATKARIVIGASELSKAVPADAVSIKFEVKLSAGKQSLQTWFLDDSGDGTVERGAYYAYVKRL